MGEVKIAEIPYLLSIMTFLPIISGIIMMFLFSRQRGNMRASQSVNFGNSSNAGNISNGDNIDADLSLEGGDSGNNSSINFALFISLITFLLSLVFIFNFDFNAQAGGGYQFENKANWLATYNITYHLGVDAISLYLIVLTTFLTPICIIASVFSIKKRLGLYLALFLILEGIVIGVFASLDFLMFYIFFEASLIPMFFIIGMWGGENRIYASFKFFLYTLLGSLLMLIALIYVYLQFGTTNIPVLTEKMPELGLNIQILLWLAFFASFAVKVPMFPFHTWLPDAHVQAPTAGSVILAGVLLKLGGYGFIRFSLPMLPDASQYFQNMMYILSAIAVIYTSLIALVQTDMKKMIAYSSIAHMGFVTAGIFSLTKQGLEGAIFQMISHGLVSAALFLCVGVLYERLHTKEIAKYGGVTNVMPRFAMFFMLFTMASVGLPGTSGFIGEFTSLIGIFKDNIEASLFITSGVILGAAYMLLLYKKVMFGEITCDKVAEFKDISRLEIVYFTIIGVFVILLGVFPNLIFFGLDYPVNNLIANFSGR